MAQPADTSFDSLSQEEKIQQAIQAVRDSIVPATGCPQLSLRQAAVNFQVPWSTLTDCYNGKRTRHEAHEGEQSLSAAQEEVLVDWIKAMGRRGIPLTPSIVIDHASEIAGKPIGKSWGQRFMKRHEDLKVCWTTGLEECRARSLNPTVVAEFYKLLEETIKEYNIPPENIYNMDEKGIQLGIGKRVAALVDRDQKTVYQVEDGNRELVTIIETICADGTTLHPSVIYQGRHRDLEWGRHNPCDARYESSLS